MPGTFSPAMRELVDIARRVAQVDVAILILGESGVGKERLARFIHDASPWAGGPFVAVNCGAVPDTLFESELFGHVRGAFTGALQDRIGLFEAANGGTLLLDEVGELPLSLQVKLLRVLQEHQIRRVGDTRHRAFDARLVAATNRNLERDVDDGRFRRDLYYRLNVVKLAIPPLRDRPEDLHALAAMILARVAARMQRPITGYSTDALRHVLRYAWPGNVRQLENAIEHACALATGPLIEPADLPPEIRHHHSLATDPIGVRPLRDVEREYILAALERNAGNRSLTAQQLGIGMATLYRKLRRYADGG